LLAFTNVRDRAGEIGILRALGVGTGRIFGLFLARAVLVGLLGAVLGWAAGSLAGAWWGEEPGAQGTALFEPAQLLLVVLAAPLLCALASLVPALLAARCDPAIVLREG
jgi:putative ABC transport system permease protein